MQINPEAQAALDVILKKDPKHLTVDEIGFLRARRDYLKDSQLREYASVLAEHVKHENQTSHKETVKKHEPQTTN